MFIHVSINDWKISYTVVRNKYTSADLKHLFGHMAEYFQ